MKAARKRERRTIALSIESKFLHRLGSSGETRLCLKLFGPSADNDSAAASLRAVALLAGGLEMRSISGRCYVVAHTFASKGSVPIFTERKMGTDPVGVSSLPCWLA